MDKPTMLEQFRRGGSYYAKNPPTLRGGIFRLSIMWLAAFGLYWVMTASTHISTLPRLVIFAAGMSVMILFTFALLFTHWRWRRQHPEKFTK
jgi:hypothetical protein